MITMITTMITIITTIIIIIAAHDTEADDNV